MHRLTKQEQLVLVIVMGLLLLGWAVKSYRLSHASSSAGAVEAVQQSSTNK